MRLPVFTDPVTDQPSFSITVAAITFAVVMVRWVIGGLTIWTHRFEPVSDATITTWLTPTLIFYLARKVTGVMEGVSMARIESPAPGPTSTSSVAINVPVAGG
jgi:hypothetical protein